MTTPDPDRSGVPAGAHAARLASPAPAPTAVRAAQPDAAPVVEDIEGAWADEESTPVVPSPGSSRLWWVVGGLLVAAAVALMAWIGVANARDNVEYHDVGFTVDSPAQVTARWQVSKPKDKQVRCLVRAMDKSFGTVGAVEVDVPAGVSEAVRVTRIKTTSLAVTGTVRSCEIVR